MTEDLMALRGLLKKCTRRRLGARYDGLAAQRLMELEVGGPTGAAHGEKSPGRRVLRDSRSWT